jgi:hypothetical protein
MGASGREVEEEENRPQRDEASRRGVENGGDVAELRRRARESTM